MAQVVMCGQLTTGRDLTRVPATKADWDVRLGKGGTLSATIRLDTDEVRTRKELLLKLEPAKTYLAVLAGDTVLEAGPIWSHDYDDETKTLTIRAGGLASLWSHRLVMKVLTAGEDPATTSLTYTGALADIARDLVRLAVSHVGGSVPVVIGEDIGGDDTRTYAGHEMATVADRLGQLAGVIAGPEVQFEPRLTEDRQGIEWLMRTGTTADPLLHQAGSASSYGDGDWIWDRRVPESGISALSVKRDANGMAYRQWATGQGTGESLLIRSVESLDMVARGYPLLEDVSSFQNVEELDTLDTHATTELISHMRPWTTWSLAARADRRPVLGTYRVGDWCQVWVPEDHLYLSQYYAAGLYRTRITGMSGDLGSTVKIDMAPTMDVR